MSAEQSKARCPSLMTQWGSHYYGPAKMTPDGLWYYEMRNDDGSVRRYPLTPIKPTIEKDEGT